MVCFLLALLERPERTAARKQRNDGRASRLGASRQLASLTREAWETRLTICGLTRAASDAILPSLGAASQGLPCTGRVRARLSFTVRLLGKRLARRPSEEQMTEPELFSAVNSETLSDAVKRQYQRRQHE